MVQIRSRLDVADNTGARMATMIGVIGKQTLYARIGDVITANVKEASTTSTVKKGEVVRAVLVRTHGDHDWRHWQANALCPYRRRDYGQRERSEHDRHCEEGRSRESCSGAHSSADQARGWFKLAFR